MRLKRAFLVAMITATVSCILLIAAQPAQAYSRDEVIALKSKLRAERPLSPAESAMANELGLTRGQWKGLNAARGSRGGSDYSRPPHNPLDEYVWSPTTYDWVDISTNGTLLPLQLDDYSDALDLGFAFDFYGTTYTQIYVASHGFVTFESTMPPGTWYVNSAIPLADQPNDAMYPLWDDNSSSDVGGIYYFADTANQRFIVSWNGVGHFLNPTETYTFQVILYANGNIVFQYQEVTMNTSCTVGIENSDGSDAMQICFDGSGDCPQVNWAVLISQPDGVPAAVSNLTATVDTSQVTLQWLDPTQDTNGNPLTIDSVQVWLGAPGIGVRLGVVLPGVQTFVHTDAPDGVLSYFVRARAGQYWGPPAVVEVIVGNPSYNEDFDVGDGLWEPDPFEGWQRGEPTFATPHSAPNVWGVGLTDIYPNDVDWYMYLNLGLAIATPTATVEFWLNYNTEFSWDGANFQVSTDEGITWEIVTPENGYPDFLWNNDPGWTGQNGGWERVVMPIGQWNGSVPQFRFYFTADPIINIQGLWIDDMIIWGLEDPVYAPISGTVTLDGGSGNVTQVAVQCNGLGSPQTNPAANGTYTLDSVLVGERRLIASLAGYHSDTLNVTLTEGGFTGANLVLRRLDPPAPTGLTGTVNSATGIVTLNWDNSADPLVDFYRVYRKLSSDPNWVLDDVRTTSDDTDTLTVDGIYQYSVSAVDDDVLPPALESARSATVTVLYGELPPTNLVANGNFDDRIRLNWLSPGVQPSFQILYDDSTSEIWMRVTTPNEQHDYFAVRFTPPSPDSASYPMPVQTCNVYMERSDPLPNVWLCPDNGGVPDMENPYMNWQEIGADGDPGWLIANANGQVLLPNESDFWMVWQFPPGSTGPGTGTDWSAPDLRSYWTYDGTPGIWNQWTSGDWMARIWVGGEPGWGFVLSVGEPSGYSIERVPSGRTVPLNEVQKTEDLSPQQLPAVGPVARRAPAKASVTTVSRTPFPIALEERLDRPYSEAPALAYQQRNGRSTLDDIVYYKIFRDGTFLVNDTIPPYDDIVGSANEDVTHSYFVRAHYDNNQDSDSSNHSSAAANMAPAAPGNINGNPIGSSQMQITWSDPTQNEDGTTCVDLASVRVYRDGTLLGTVNAGVQTYTDTPPDPQTFYAWTVRAIDEVPNEGPPSTQLVAAVQSPWQTCDYEWVDITGNGTPVVQCDDCNEGPFTLGFDFEYFGQTYSDVRVCSNGWLSFSSQFNNLDFPCPAFPMPDEPNAVISAFTDDLLPSGGQCRYFEDTANDRFIVSWDNCPHWGSGETYTFQIILTSNGSVTFNYQTIPIAESAVIGVENEDGSQGLEVNCHGAGPFTPADQTSVCFWGGPSGSLEGVVRAFGNNQPIQGVRVETAEVPEFTFTDASGFYSLPLEPGTYTVMYTRQGYCDTTFANILIEDNNITVRNVTMRAPSAQFSVTSLTLPTWPGHIVADTVIISNNGGQCPLEFAITDTSAWLSEDPAAGTIPVNGSVIVMVYANPAGLPPGSDHQTTMIINHGALNSPTTIPVTFSIALASDDPGIIPTEYALYQNYPNPFNATTSMRFDIPQASRVKLVLYNVTGQVVSTVVDAMYPAGRHQVQYDATDLPSGMYLMKLEAGSFMAMRKMLMLK